MPTQSLADIFNLPIVMPEVGSGTREVIENAFRNKNILIPKSPMVLGSTESIKNFILYSDTFAFLCMHSIRKELKHQSIKIIDIEDFEIPHMVLFYYPTGGPV